MITLISTPAYAEPANPLIICRWLATESPNNFRLLRHDFNIVTASDNGGFLQLTFAAGTFTGQIGDVISVYNKTLDAMYSGTVAAGSGTTTVETDIVFRAGFDPTDTALDPTRLITYLNDNTLHGCYYFEGRLTINGVLNTLTIIASPDSFGYADLDVSGVLRIVTSLGKTGDYTALIMAEPTKSGTFSLEYRECWFGSNEAWEESEGVGSPPAPMTYYYCESIRSEEQGSNLHDFMASSVNDAPFMNGFDQPVYFRGLPFDLSFILPLLTLTSPFTDLTITIESFDSQDTLIYHWSTTFSSGNIQEFLCSLSIDDTMVPAGTDFFTAEITAP